MHFLYYFIISYGLLFNIHSFAGDSLESLSGIFDFDIASFQGKPGAEEDTRIAKTWTFAMARLNAFINAEFQKSNLPGLAKRVDDLGKEIFKFEIYKSKLKPRSQQFVEYKSDIYEPKELLFKLESLEKKKNDLKKDLDKKAGLKEKAKLFFSSKTTKVIKNDEQDVKAFLSGIVDKLGQVLVNVKKIVQDPVERESIRRRG